MCRQSTAQLKGRLANFALSIFVVGQLILSSCSTGIESGDSSAPVGNYKGLEICDQKPSDGATNVARNARIAIVVDDVLDAWSVSSDNIQVWTEGGAQFGGKLLINHDIVRADSSTPRCPQNKAVSRIVIAPGSGASFIPGQTYKVLFRDRNGESDATSQVVLGLAAQGTGARLQQQVVSFTVGTNFAGSNTSLEVIGMTPGRILNRNGDGSPTDLQSLVSSYFTIDKQAPIQIAFNAAFRHQAYDNGNANPTNPIPVMPLYSNLNPNGFLGVALGMVSDSSQLNEILNAISNFSIDNPIAWENGVSALFTQGQLRATVESADRKNLIIRPQQDYPETAGQVIVVLVQGFASRASRMPQKQNIYIGAFWHQGNFQTGIGMPDPKTWLRDGLLR